MGIRSICFSSHYTCLNVQKHFSKLKRKQFKEPVGREWHPKEGDTSTWNYVYFVTEMK